MGKVLRHAQRHGRPKPRRVIVRKARRKGLDPRAVISVAMGEGGLRNRRNDIGDLSGGGSYGPFQLYARGALPARFRGRPRAADRWAWSPAGIVYPLNQMVKAGARGKKGHQAIETIIRKFERPADPDSSVRNAKRRYGSVKVASSKRALRPQGRIVKGAMRSGGGRHRPRDYAAGEVLSPLGEIDFSGLQVREQAAPTGPVRMPHINPYLPELPPNPRAQQYPRMATPPRYAQPGRQRQRNILGGGSWPTAKHGKIIGTPYSGTHTLGNWESDNAIDISVPRGTPIRATRNGVITRVSIRPEGGRISGSSIHLDWGKNEAFFTHLSRVTVKAGQHVRKGQIIGYSGVASGVPHLHAGVKHGDPRKVFRRGPKKRKRRKNIRI